MLGKCSHPRSPTLLAHLLPGVGHPLPPPSPVQAPGSSREQEGPGQQQEQEEEGGLRGRQDGGLQGSRTPWGQQGGGVRLTLQLQALGEIPAGDPGLQGQQLLRGVLQEVGDVGLDEAETAGEGLEAGEGDVTIA